MREKQGWEGFGGQGEGYMRRKAKRGSGGEERLREGEGKAREGQGRR